MSTSSTLLCFLCRAIASSEKSCLALAPPGHTCRPRFWLSDSPPVDGGHNASRHHDSEGYLQEAIGVPSRKANTRARVQAEIMCECTRETPNAGAKLTPGVYPIPTHSQNALRILLLKCTKQMTDVRRHGVPLPWPACPNTERAA
eukprot:3821950-Pyramimonas_sp.AAC.2